MGGQLLCLGCKSGQQGTLCIRKYPCNYVLPPLLSKGHMAMNADLLAPGNTVFYLAPQGVLATVVGRLSFLECVAISCERSDHLQFYCDCPVEWLTFPRPALPDAVHPHRLPPLWGPQLQPTFRIVLRVRALVLRRRMTPNIFKLHLSFHKTPWATASLSGKAVQYIGK